MRALEDPHSLLAQSDRMVIDEIQRAPDLLSFVVAELVKHFTTVRRDAPLYHWRDATGHEIDVSPVTVKFLRAGGGRIR